MGSESKKSGLKKFDLLYRKCEIVNLIVYDG